MSWRTEEVLRDVDNERREQEHKWGEQNHVDLNSVGTFGVEWVQGHFAKMERTAKEINDDPAHPPEWSYILLEEVYEALAETDPHKKRTELVQVAAVAVAWIECMDRKEDR